MQCNIRTCIQMHAGQCLGGDKFDFCLVAVVFNFYPALSVNSIFFYQASKMLSQLMKMFLLSVVVAFVFVGVNVNADSHTDMMAPMMEMHDDDMKMGDDMNMGDGDMMMVAPSGEGMMMMEGEGMMMEGDGMTMEGDGMMMEGDGMTMEGDGMMMEGDGK
eukprot:TRINITY_DN1807_c0_g1_i6.p2 TRINITY_DN1807_c0_g1~~TRINITY_DN1807_c0_g1_i6.p2  ORF type:complete len:160 (+),score=37.04 TRINITY_DN1807_c0_g1_i6:481-960(+)